jgi:hypothetical protein
MMPSDRPRNAEEEMTHLATSLRGLLNAQLAAGREGNLSRVERLSEKANAAVAKIASDGGDESAVLGAERRELKRLYEELTLILRAEQADVQNKLKQLRKVKRVVAAYRTDR